MYSIRIRDHIMIAHSLKGEVFGPAQKMHGATYVVDVVFKSTVLSSDGIVYDIGKAHEDLKSILTPLNYQNLDKLPQFKDKVTTTEFLAKYIHDEMKQLLQNEFNGFLEVTLGESHVAWASYSGEGE